MFLRFIASAALFLIATHCSAEEIVILKSGFGVNALSHTYQGSRLLLQTGSGTIEFALSDVARIEQQTESAVPTSTPPSVMASKDRLVDSAKLLEEAAFAQGLETAFVRSVARIESGFRQDATSKKGALGLMQLMPGTAKDLGVDARQARDNALGGAKYLRALLLRYHYNSALALAAYNAGPGAVQRFGGVPPYAETRNYVRKVTREYDRELERTSRAKTALPKSGQ